MDKLALNSRRPTNPELVKNDCNECSETNFKNYGTEERKKKLCLSVGFDQVKKFNACFFR
jgi:hypothetical protein